MGEKIEKGPLFTTHPATLVFRFVLLYTGNIVNAAFYISQISNMRPFGLLILSEYLETRSLKNVVPRTFGWLRD